MRRIAIAAAAALAAAACAGPAGPATAFNLFGPYPWGTEGEIYYSKWGDFHHAGAHGGQITWSIMPDGTTIDPSFTDPSFSGTSSLENIMNGLGYDQALAAIHRAFDRWSAVANIYFEQVPDSGAPFNSAAAATPNAGVIRLGAFPIANFNGGAVGYAPHPNGFTSLEGDILLNANSTFFLDDGAEGALIDVFNDFESLIQHETGHAVGLDHSDAQSVMSVDFEIYKYVNRELDADDVAGVQFLYGPALAPDFDRDNDVDGQDLTAWATGFGIGMGAFRVDGDSDRDGDVDGGDVLIWQRELGGGAAPNVASVPEPSADQLIPLGALMFAFVHVFLDGASSQSVRRGARQKCSINTPHFGHLANHIGTDSPHLQRILCRTTDDPSRLLPLELAVCSSGGGSKTDASAPVLPWALLRSSR